LLKKQLKGGEPFILYSPDVSEKSLYSPVFVTAEGISDYDADSNVKYYYRSSNINTRLDTVFIPSLGALEDANAHSAKLGFGDVTTWADDHEESSTTAFCAEEFFEKMMMMKRQSTKNLGEDLSREIKQEVLETPVPKKRKENLRLCS
jgi:hypothetical protein